MIQSKEQLIYSTHWRCPSNIAIVKYWGKKKNQIPCNASLSMTLSKSYTDLKLELFPKTSQSEIELAYFFDGERNRAFEERVKKYIWSQKIAFPFIAKYALHFSSVNSFPHSAGIASSASAFGAIALVLMSVKKHFDTTSIHDFYSESSHYARLGSGSASRSMFPYYALWGKVDGIEDSNDNVAIPVEEIHENFQSMKDAILIVEDCPKHVSSSVGHSLMNGHPYATQRFSQANLRVIELIDILKTGDFDQFIHLTESEALTLHAMMMTSKDYYLLMKPNTISAIENIMTFREETKLPICFTLDAGPNLHVLYPASVEKPVEYFLKNNFQNQLKGAIFDALGFGPTIINE